MSIKTSNIIVTIDGLAGSGKSTVSAKLARKLGFIHLNSGALYRAIALKANDLALCLEDEGAIVAVVKETSFEFVLSQNKTSLLVDGQQVDSRIKEPVSGELASRVAVLEGLRVLLNEVQRDVVKQNLANGGVVVEGRDAGSVVFPDADLKIYLEASLEKRVFRRVREAGGEDFSGKQLEDAQQAARGKILTRDKRDSSREFAPLVVPQGASVIDTSDLSVDEVVEKIEGFLKEKNLG